MRASGNQWKRCAASGKTCSGDEELVYSKFKLSDNKHIGMHFLDISSTESAEDPPLADKSKWKHRVVEDIRWLKRTDWVAKSKLFSTLYLRNQLRTVCNDLT